VRPFNIAPFALPNHAINELVFEEPRDIERVVVTFRDAAPHRLRLSYLRQYWPGVRVEEIGDADRGWIRVDDRFRAVWQNASIRTERVDDFRVAVTFKGLRRELRSFAGDREYDVTFRRTLGIRVGAPKADAIRDIAVSTRSEPAQSTLRVELDAGKRTRATRLSFAGYNAVIGKVMPGKGTRLDGECLRLGKATRREFLLHVLHMRPAHPHCYDDGLVTFGLGDDAFTISLSAMGEHGPIWYAEKGAFINLESDPTTFAEYRKSIAGAMTVTERVLNQREQSFGGATHCQPRPHAAAFCVGCKRARQSFWIEPNGDVVLHGRHLKDVPGRDTERFLNDGNGRFFFGLERCCVEGRNPDAPPVLVYNIRLRRGDLAVEQKCLAVPLEKSVSEQELAGDDTIVGLVRFKMRNAGNNPIVAELSVGYSSDSQRALLRLARQSRGQNDDMIPQSLRERLTARDGRILGRWHGKDVLRAAYETTMVPHRRAEGLVFKQKLARGASCELLLKVPYVALDSEKELAALDALGFDECYREVEALWRREGSQGAQLRTPEPALNAAYRLHLPIVLMTDFAMPDASELVNTSVGTNTYRNYANEACMIQEELDQRGLPDEARRRLAIYVKYQGQGAVLGNFTDYDGLYFATGGFEGNSSYNQNHGWVMWRLADHYFMTGDEEWLRGMAGSLVAAADWVFRQRKNTMEKLPNSRGWEYGFLPAGGLEDVTDHCYWLVNNVMSWRGTEWAARALEAIGHPQAPRIRSESDAYRRDILRALEGARQRSPLVRLNCGRWVPHFPSRLYRRGRDAGWIREVLEGSIQLLLSGLIDARSREAGWILDDYQDNRYGVRLPGYMADDPKETWFANGGFSLQPNLLAGLLPHLERDEVEAYIRMFFNAFASCYQEEMNALIEHPFPVGGYYGYRSFKTSDASNAMKWLVYMFVYEIGDTLHLGRALPREWLSDGDQIWAKDVVTHFGRVGVRYRSDAARDSIAAELNLNLRRRPRRTLVRFRHPDKKPVRKVTVNGRSHTGFKPLKGDVDITGLEGRVEVIASY